MPTIVPHLWFDTQAKEAAAFYTAIFPDSKVTNVTTLRDTPSSPDKSPCDGSRSPASKPPAKILWRIASTVSSTRLTAVVVGESSMAFKPGPL